MATTTEVRLAREMRLIDITMIGVGAMIGAGIFVLTGIAAGIAGPALLLVFLLNGVVTLFAASAYAELGSAFHDAGGGYLWVKSGLPDPQGFLSGWMSWFAHAVACSLYALGFGAYFEVMLHALGVGVPALPLLPLQKWLAVAVVAAFSFINYRGASETGKAGNIVTVGKIIILAVFIGFGVAITLRRPDWQATFQDFMPRGMTGVFTAMGLTFIAFEGYEIIAQCSEEVQNPRRNVPRAVFLSLIIVVPIYLLVAFAALGAVQASGMPSWQFLGLHKETALVDVASGFFRGGGAMILVGGLLSTVSALNATIYSSSRVSYAMGRDRNLPSWFGRVHPQRRTPHVAITVSAVLIAIMAVALPIEAVASASDIMFLLLFMQVLWVLIALRRKRPDLDRGFRVPWVPVIPVIGILCQLFLAAFLFAYSPRAWFTAAAWIAVGVGVYYAYARKRDQAYARVVASREAAARREYRVLACIANPATAAPILQLAGTVARPNDGEVVALHVVEVPDGEVLARGLPDAVKARRELEAVVAPHADLRVRTLVKVAHRTSFAIIETAVEERCNLIIMGRAKHPSFLERLGATVVDRVLRSAPAQALIVTAETWPRRVRSVLIPVTDGAHAGLAITLGAAIARSWNARIRVVRVVRPETVAQLGEPGSDGDDGGAVQTLVRREMPGTELRTVLADDPADGVIEQARGADAIFMGGAEAGLLDQLFAYPVPLDVAERAPNPVVMFFEIGEH
jgi:amino acid transporter/nucleotide-binding universal stress UspA family protein